jgi:CRISPR-associated endonuclease/helicase Cas3
MMVTFVSQCEKKALSKTRRVLDAFANRIGDNTWQTVMTQDGLLACKSLLNKTASKSTAVSCHWARSRSRSDLLWIVGSRNKFDSEGFVPVNSTRKKLTQNQWENDWHYLPLIKALVAVAALLHDWGKATLLFQNKLNPKGKTKAIIADPLRHEWISCLLLDAVVQQSGDHQDDAAWLHLLTSGTLDEGSLVSAVSQSNANPLGNLPPLAELVAWLIVTHHRLPALKDKDRRNSYSIEKKATIKTMLNSIRADWGYQNKYDEADYNKRLADCFKFPQGLLSHSQVWLKSLQKWTARLFLEKDNAQTVIENGAWRVVLHHARLSLMLGDHYYSSLTPENTPKWQGNLELYANTYTKDGKMLLKQKLDEHLVRVSEHGLRISQSLSRFSTEMSVAYDIRTLRRKSPQGFEWQDKATEKITAFRKQNETLSIKNYGCFVVNMASTGCGKTIANAKIMRALSDDGDSLRYILALGLRTLTLQTGDEYRERIGLSASELAVLIGSSAVKELHEQAQKASQKTLQKHNESPSCEDLGSESLDTLLDEDLDYCDDPTADFLDAIIPKNDIKQACKNNAFLYKPVLACTIDHIIAATETTRGGKYILPCLRLLSSDLVIDEVDDFDGKDLVAMGRLIHLAGMLGRKVMISSATIPPALAEGFFNAYYEGWQIHCQFKKITFKVACIWIDEFATQMDFVHGTDSSEAQADQALPIHCKQYRTIHQQFSASRAEKLRKQVIRRKGYIVQCDALSPPTAKQQSIKKPTHTELSAKEQQYFMLVQEAALKLHASHHTVDRQTGKKVSFGVIRVANIPPCIALTKYLLQAEWPADVIPKVMAYHSRQVLLLRHEQETHLDAVLKRKEKSDAMPIALSDPLIRAHLTATTAMQVLFIVVATPVEEVGRDHDFDWAVVEPSSYRSIIQLAGRVCRHRQTAVATPNIAVMQYNLKALRQNGSPAYCRPGYENAKSLKLQTHDLSQLLDETVLNTAVNAIPRIMQPEPLQPKSRLADLEHQAIGNSLAAYHHKGAGCLQAWLTECWWMTALPQQLNRFRDSNQDMALYWVWRDGTAQLCEKNEQGRFIKSAGIYGITPAAKLNEIAQSRLWLNRSYEQALQTVCDRDDIDLTSEELQREMYYKSIKYGELTLPMPLQKGDVIDMQHFWYSDQFGLWPKK